MQRGAKEPTLVEIYWYNNVTDKFSGRVHVRKDRAEGLVLFERTDGDGSRTPWHGEFFPLDGGIRMRLDPSLKNQRDFKEENHICHLEIDPVLQLFDPPRAQQISRTKQISREIQPCEAQERDIQPCEEQAREMQPCEEQEGEIQLYEEQEREKQEREIQPCEKQLRRKQELEKQQR